jgi:hypothetical protein
VSGLQVLRGLGSAPLSAALGASATPEHARYMSALPLWAFQQVSRSRSQVLLQQSTLVLPASDYAALLAAALRGEAWKEGAVQTAALISGIVVFIPSSVQPSGELSPSLPSLLLVRYSGWWVAVQRACCPYH